ncbi:hypothetical protein [Ferruginibacter albus]|uniref:hypothetical protein n=1 Tax=Ferruginibacter albus TaxID=2875540 RepID=UPI001CC514BF|nr:hypothetical protein [Ferruginibacter albus]UAY50843.1 hypothetical protein K9M53_09600 [Ferruginibacter albus]
MKSLKSIIAGVIILMAFVIAGCTKENYPSRDTSGILPPVIDTTTPPPPVDTTLVMFDACDAVGDWGSDWQTVGTPIVQTTGQKEGTGYIQGTITTGNDFLQFIKQQRTPALDTKTTVDNGQLTFWLNIPDVSKLKLDGQIQISSSGTNPDSKRYGWDFASIIPTLQNGWNHITLDLSAANVAGDGPADLTAVNFFKMFFWTADKTTADFVCAIDGIQFKRKQTTTPPPDNSVEIDPADAIDGWETVGTPVIATTGQKQGTGYLQGTIHPDNDFLQFIKTLATNVDTKVTMTTGQLQFWFYVPDVSLMKLDGQIQFGSAKDPDKNRIGWGLANIIPTLNNGWNLIKLNFADAYVSGDGGPDLTAMNYFKMFFWLNNKPAADQTFGIDDIKVVAVPPPPPVVIDNCDAADGWETVGTPVIATAGQKEGAGYLQGTLKTGNDFLQFIKTLPTNVDTKVTIDNGQLQFWFFVPDVSILKLDGQIQFSSAKDPDKNRVGWGLANIIPTLNNGWNLVKLNLSDGYVSGDGGPDLTAMNYFKIFFWSTDKVAVDYTFGIDNIIIQRK